MDRAEATGFGVSVLGHGALLLVAWLIVNRPVPPEVSRAFEVSYVDEVGLTSASPSPSSTPAAAPTAPEAGPVEDARSEPEPTPPPPSPALSPSAEARPAPPRPTPRPTPRATPGTGERTTREDVRDWDPNRFGGDPSSRSNNPPAATYGPAERASVNQAIARALRPCARQPLPADDADRITVEYRVTLNRDGSLASVQFLRVNNPNPDLARYERRMRDLGMNVLRACTPIRDLPQAFYDVRGGQFPYTFDPRAGR